MRDPGSNRQTPSPKELSFGLQEVERGLPIGSAGSILLHMGFLVVALLAWQTTPKVAPEDVVAVDIISERASAVGPQIEPQAEQSGAQTPDPAPLPQDLAPAQSSPLPEPQIAPPLSVPEPDPEPRPQPAPAPAPLPKANVIPPLPPIRPALPKPVTKPTPPPPPVTKPRPAAAKPKANAPAKPQTRASAPEKFDIASAMKEASGADSGGRRTPGLTSSGKSGRLGKAGGGVTLTGDLEAALRAQIKECWAEPADMSNRDRLQVVISIDLGLDGRLMRDPVLVRPSSRAGADPTLLVAIDNALRATRQCAPYNLPPDRYETWRQVRFSFDPKRMARQ